VRPAVEQCFPAIHTILEGRRGPRVCWEQFVVGGGVINIHLTVFCLNIQNISTERIKLLKPPNNGLASDIQVPM
jgi:hypothetical protein